MKNVGEVDLPLLGDMSPKKSIFVHTPKASKKHQKIMLLCFFKYFSLCISKDLEWSKTYVFYKRK